ncbi:MAG TPA: radical SAM/Cys-rich domain protein [Gammaproteobacteria bacterium]|nr:radical SAM/Cys-rich domain protein [Gammaproteobacteria bacterium]
MHATLPLLQDSDFPQIRRDRLETVQVNMGYLCNQQCLHCHVNAGPNRKEIMDEDTIRDVLEFIKHSGARSLDLTGGAPELNPHFRLMVKAAGEAGCHVIDRCNLTILAEPGQQELGSFLAENRVEIVASMPCYLEKNVDAQRGKGVFVSSIRALKQLNGLGYGQPGTGLILNLVYNPQGARLPPPQESLEQDYRKNLGDQFGIAFSNLFTLTNMPIKRFGSTLVSHGQFDSYVDLLKQNSVKQNITSVMCRTLVSIDWQGYVYDCDFNQMLEIPLADRSAGKVHISRLNAEQLPGKSIAVADHCYACTAGQGSSCGGALVP